MSCVMERYRNELRRKVDRIQAEVDRLRTTLAEAADPTVPGGECERAELDAEVLGVGFLVDGERVSPERVVIFKPATTTASDGPELEQVVMFLLGEDEIGSYWFHETPPGKGPYWWRIHLRDAWNLHEARRPDTTPTVPDGDWLPSDLRELVREAITVACAANPDRWRIVLARFDSWSHSRIASTGQADKENDNGMG